MLLGVSPRHKPLAWLGGELKTPPLSPSARIEAGVLLRKLQAGETLPMPHSSPMPVVGPRCHELRIQDEAIELSQDRLRRYDEACKGRT